MHAEGSASWHAGRCARRKSVVFLRVATASEMLTSGPALPRSVHLSARRTDQVPSSLGFISPTFQSRRKLREQSVMFARGVFDSSGLRRGVPKFRFRHLTYHDRTKP
jgi:hypothetical protein